MDNYEGAAAACALLHFQFPFRVQCCVCGVAGEIVLICRGISGKPVCEKGEENELKRETAGDGTTVLPEEFCVLLGLVEEVPRLGV